jgi:hypothetical protein
VLLAMLLGKAIQPFQAPEMRVDLPQQLRPMI